MGYYNDYKVLEIDNRRLLELTYENNIQYSIMKKECIKYKEENIRLNSEIAKLKNELNSLKSKAYKTKSNAYKMGITKEELKIFLSEGVSIKEIAKQFSVSPNTIRNRIREYQLEYLLQTVN